MKKYLLLLLAWVLLSGFNAPGSGSGYCGPDECLDGSYTAEDVDAHIDDMDGTAHGITAESISAIECSGGSYHCSGSRMVSGVAGQCPLTIRGNSGDTTDDKLILWENSDGDDVAYVTEGGMILYTSLAASGSTTICEDYTWEVEGSFIIELDSEDECSEGFQIRAGDDSLAFGVSEAGGVSVYTSLNIPTSSTLPATCEVGDIYHDNDATSGQQFYICESTNTWALQGDGGGTTQKDIVTTSPLTGGEDNVLPGADADLTLAVTVQKDLVTDSPLTGGTDDILTGSDSDVTLGITVEKDLVTTAPLSGGTDDILTGSDSDVTISLDTTTGRFDLGGARSLEIPNNNAADIDTQGQIKFEPDKDGLEIHDGTNKVGLTTVKKTIQFTIGEPDQLDEGDTLPIWQNRTGYVFLITAIRANSDIDNLVFTLKEVNNAATDFSAITTVDQVEVSDDGTSVYYKVVTGGIDHTRIEDGHVIVFDNSASDAAYLQVTIEGELR